MVKDKLYKQTTRTIVELLMFTMVISLVIVSPSLLANDSAGDSSYDLFIEEILCRGNENTDCDFILKKYYQGIGEKVNPEEIADARLRLGTLQQFKNVRIVLEKGSERGRVNVVFIVDEANYIQYNIASDFSRSDDKRSSSEFESLHFKTGLTNFNFLGTGKQLSFSIDYSDHDISRDTTLYDQNRELVPAKLNASGSSTGASLTYHDPHLFDSTSYYLTATYNYSKRDSESLVGSVNTGSTLRYQSVFDSENHTYGLTIGRRFGSNSYIEALAYKSDSDGTQTSIAQVSGSEVPFSTGFGAKVQDYTIAYGWDSRDDLIFPTKGTVFTVRADHLDNEFRRNLSASFSQNISINDSKVFTYTVGEFEPLTHDDNNDYEDYLSSFAAFTLSDIDTKLSKEGTYSGWKYNLSLPLKSSSLYNAALGVSYIYQTDYLILQLSATYQKD